MNAIPDPLPTVSPLQTASTGVSVGVPCTFASDAGPIFGWYHAPAGPGRDVAVVLCTPVGHEWLWSYRSYVKLAERLAAEGMAVLRFDYHGTGDSAGDDRDPNRFEAWLSSTRGAAQHAKALSSATKLVFVGVRVGALLAGLVASELPETDALVLFAPCASGRLFVRELKAFRMLQHNQAPSGERPKLPGEPYEEVAGFAFTASTLTSLSKANLYDLPRAPAPGVLVIPRDDGAPDAKLIRSLESLGSEVTPERAPGYEQMMREPHESELPTRAFDAIARYLTDRTKPAKTVDPDDTRVEDAGLRQSAVFDLAPDGYRERAVVFGSHQHLFGLLTEPASGARSEQPALLMLNVGTNHRVGPNRMYVRMARRWAKEGLSSLRFDLAGMGDSQSAESFAETRLYSKHAVEDVVAAMDHLQEAHGIQRFVLIGLCSGAYVAFQTALVEPRVSDIVLVNARRFYWQPGDTLESAMNTSYKSMRAYRELFMQPQTWKRLVKGEIDVKGISGRVRVLAESRAKALTTRLLKRDAEDESGVVPAFRSICDRGTHVLFIFSEGDDGLDYFELHLGHRARRIKRPEHVRVEMIRGSDHTFTEVWTQELLAEKLGGYFRAGALA